MISSIVVAGLLSFAETLKLSQQAKFRVVGKPGASQCEDTTRADEFYSYTKFGVPANGKRVQDWLSMYPTWSFGMLEGASMCMLRGDTLMSDETGVQVVLDFTTPNDLTCCKSGERPTRSRQEFDEGMEGHNINSTRFDFIIPKSNKHDEKTYFYEVAVPKSCQLGGENAPCPLLVSLHGMALDHVPHMAMECSDCMHDMGVVTALLYIPDAVTHDLENHVTYHNLAWDSALWVGEEFVRPVTQQVLKDYAKSIDATRLFVFGLSMGGAGALMDAIIMPDLFNEAYVVSPKSFMQYSKNTLGKIQDEDWRALYNARKTTGAGTLKKIYIFSGNEEENGPDVDLDLIPQSLAAAGLDKAHLYVEYRMFNYAHDCWLAAFETVYERVWKGK